MGHDGLLDYRTVDSSRIEKKTSQFTDNNGIRLPHGRYDKRLRYSYVSQTTKQVLGS